MLDVIGLDIAVRSEILFESTVVTVSWWLSFIDSTGNTDGLLDTLDVVVTFVVSLSLDELVLQ